MSNDKFHGDAELAANFTYASAVSAPMTIHYSVHVHGETQSAADIRWGNAYTNIQYKVGLWDGTTNQGVVEFQAGTVETFGDGSKKIIDGMVQGAFIFPNPTPGHWYFVYFYCHIEGNSSHGGAKGSIVIDGIAGNVYITF